ncbi:ead/Ea22-like family protein [Serratia ureilytica]|uniref:ead/Ea22-like family protein n=1 Tax=Serratia ureilytica TaxID=300181 RepID=UPI00191FAF7F|nr:ead/Ea22-like family protein [Serratia ureilytica]MBL0880623.1 ead/Ea22-like family protein [Serratia ureilytica]MDN2472884.1 ead/Ea22-like family protein [Serratia ureilytica]
MDKFSELKAAAMAATPGPWESVYDDWSDGEDALISCESRNGMVPIAKIEGGGSNSGYNEPFSAEQQANALYIAVANPAVVLDVLAELEAKDERIKWLESISTDYIGKFQKVQDALKYAAIMSDEDKKKIAELEEQKTKWVGWSNELGAKLDVAEKRLATPVRLQSPWVDKAGNRWLLEGTTADVIRASGFAVTVEGGCVG